MTDGLYIALKQAWVERDDMALSLEATNNEMRKWAARAWAVETEREALAAALEWARKYDPYSSRACPLCTYAQGELLATCNLHKEISELKAELQAWRDGGLTEEILRRNDGTIKDTEAEIAALKAERE